MELHRKLLFVIMLLLVGIALQAPLSLGENSGWTEKRQTGSSLDGFWFAVKDGGCFESSTVYYLRNRKTYLFSKGRQAFDAPVSFSSNNGEAVMSLSLKPNQKRTLTFEDAGDELFTKRIINEENGVIISESNERVPAFRTCDNPTMMGHFYSLVNDPFVPPS
jgi:hypothetical protein